MVRQPGRPGVPRGGQPLADRGSHQRNEHQTRRADPGKISGLMECWNTASQLITPPPHYSIMGEVGPVYAVLGPLGKFENNRLTTWIGHLKSGQLNSYQCHQDYL